MKKVNKKLELKKALAVLAATVTIGTAGGCAKEVKNEEAVDTPSVTSPIDLESIKEEQIVESNNYDVQNDELIILPPEDQAMEFPEVYQEKSTESNKNNYPWIKTQSLGQMINSLKDPNLKSNNYDIPKNDQVPFPAKDPATEFPETYQEGQNITPDKSR